MSTWKQLLLRWRAHYTKSEVIRQSFLQEFSDYYSYTLYKEGYLYTSIFLYLSSFVGLGKVTNVYLH